jgi:hypothetical protein
MLPSRPYFSRRSTFALTLVVATSLMVATTVSLLAVRQPAASADTASSTFVLGTSNASAQVLSVPLALGGDNLGVTEALSNAGYTDVSGQAESEIVATGLTGDLPIPVPSQLAPLEATSTSTLVSSSKTLAGSSTAGAGAENVAASQSSGLASTSLTGLDAAGDIVISGGQSEAAGSIIKGATRQATSSASIASISLLNGLVVLSGLQWSSTQSTGASSAAAGSFSLGAIKVAGVDLPVSAPDLTSDFTTINAALAETGIHINPPREIVSNTGSVTESPLTIGLDNSALGLKVFSPVVSAIQPLRTVLFNELATLSTETGAADLAVEIVLGILAGQGSVDLDVGGSYASTNGTVYTDPFGSAGSSASGNAGIGGLGPAPSQPAGAGLNTAGGSFVGGTGSPAEGASVVTTTTVPPAGSVKSATPVRLASSTSCQSTTVGGCSSSSAKTVAIILVAGTALLALAEYLRQRRKLRALGEAPSPIDAVDTP